MSYTKHNFQSGEKLYASQLNAMDDQIALNESRIDEIEENATVNYNNLTNKPSLNGVTLSGSMTSADLGIPSAEGIPDMVDDWLDENISNPDSPPLDRSLSSSSAAAPADLVGEELTSIKEDLSKSQVFGKYDLTDKDDYFVAQNGSYYPTTNNIYSKAINVLAGQTIVLDGYGYLTNVSIFAKRTGTAGNYTYTSLVVCIDSNKRIYTYTATEDMTIIVSFMTKVGSTDLVNECYTMYSLSDRYKELVDKIHDDVATAIDGVNLTIEKDMDMIYNTDLFYMSNISSSVIASRGISNAGGIIYDAEKTLYKYKVTAGTLLYLDLGANSGASSAVYVFKAGDDLSTETIGDVHFGAIKDKIVVPQRALYFYVSQPTNSTFTVKSVNTSISKFDEKIDSAALDRSLTFCTWEQGWYNGSGQYGTSDTHRFCTSDFLEADSQTIEVADPELSCYVIYFDTNKGYAGASSVFNKIFFVPLNYPYFKVQIYKSTATIADTKSVAVYIEPEKRIIKDNKDKDVVVSNFSKSRSSLLSNPYIPLEFVHFSDVHRQPIEWKNVCDYMDAHSDYIGFAIHTGDYCMSYNAQYTDLYEIATPKDGYILNVVGNHDVYSNSSGSERASQADTKALLFNHTSDWGVTFGTENAMYYHKDFDDSGIRLVVVDLYYWDSTEATWFTNILADAKENDLAVITAMHIATASLPTNKRVNCTFNIIDELGTASTGESDTIVAIDNAIASFIEGGGEFIVNLCGHYHHDVVGYSAGDVLNIAVECATHLPANWDDAIRDESTRAYNAFNVIAIDRTTKTIRIARIGNNSDWYGRAKNVLCYNYDTKQIVANY